MTVSAIVTVIAVFVIFPVLQADVNRSAADARYAKQQELLARAEIERARAVTVSAKGEADALRMSVNQPVVIVAVGSFALTSVALMILLSMYVMRQMEMESERKAKREKELRNKTVVVYIDGKLETLFVPDGATPALVAQRYLSQFEKRDLVVIDSMGRMDGW